MAGVSERGTGGAAFAGGLLVIGGGLWALQGIAGLVEGSSYNSSTDHWITTSATTWGWVHLIGGLIVVAAGIGIVNGAVWARTVGIVVASISVLVNFTFIPLAPWWAFTIILVDLWVIHSLFVHGRVHER